MFTFRCYTFILIYLLVFQSNYFFLPVVGLEKQVPEIIILGNESRLSTCQNELNRAVTLQQHNKVNHRQLMDIALCFHREKDTVKALQVYHHIRSTTPHYSYVLINIAIIHQKDGNPIQARSFVEQYLEEVGGIHGNNGGRLVDLDSKLFGTPCRTASTYKSNCIQALNVLGSTYTSQLNYTLAQRYFYRAIEIGGEDDGDMLEYIYSNLGGSLIKTGDADGAAKAFLKSFWISVHKNNINPSVLVRRAILVPLVSASLEDAYSLEHNFISRVRDIIQLANHGGKHWNTTTIMKRHHDSSSDLFLLSQGVSKIEDIQSLPPLKGTLKDWMNGIQTPHFHLHYYGFHDRPIQELVAKMYQVLCPAELFQVAHNVKPETIIWNHPQSIPYHNPLHRTSDSMTQTAAQSTNNNNDSTQPKLRIGFISSLFGNNEPHGLLLVDVIRRLPKSIFESFAIGIGVAQPSKLFMDAVSGNYIKVGFNDGLIRKTLKTLQLDCLVYAEMQNEAILHFLGFERHAPVQIVVMGAPVTSGNPSIDYFMSGDRLEMVGLYQPLSYYHMGDG